MEGYNPHASLLPAGNGHITAMSGGGAPNGYDPTQSLLQTSGVPIVAHKGGNRQRNIDGHIFTISKPGDSTEISDDNTKALAYLGLEKLDPASKKQLLEELYETDFNNPFTYGIKQELIRRLIEAYLKLEPTNDGEEDNSNNDFNRLFIFLLGTKSIFVPIKLS